MYQLSETELTNRINTFISKKSEQFPELRLTQGRNSSEQISRYDMHKPTFIEKANEFWSTWVHA